MRIQLWQARGIPGYLLAKIDEETGTYLTDDKNTILVQTDWDYPSVAAAFGFIPCACDATDGTVDCEHFTVSEMISEAAMYLDAHVGDIVEDPGTFLNSFLPLAHTRIRGQEGSKLKRRGYMKNKTEHGVRIQYGRTSIKLTANEVRLIADALAIIDPDTATQSAIAGKLEGTFSALADYAESL